MIDMNRPIRPKLVLPGATWLKAVVVFVCFFAAPPANAEPPSASGALSAKQEMIRDRIRRLEDRMFRLREKLATTEPDSAAKLARAIEGMGQSGLDQTADELLLLLSDKSRLATAADLQQELLKEMDNVLAILLKSGEAESRKTRMQWLDQQWQDVEQLLDRQQSLRDQTAAQTLAAEQAQQLEGLAKRIDALTARQKKLLEEEDADAQAQLGEDTKRLADEIAKASASPDAQGNVEESAEKAKSAAQEMNSAAEALSNDDHSKAERHQLDAIDKLEQAKIDILRSAKASDEQQHPGTPPADLADPQKALSQGAEALSEQMQGTPQGTSKQSQERSGSKDQTQSPQEPAPGQMNVDQARSHMENAAEELEQDDARQATRDQDRAIEELEQAREKLEAELQQLRREERQDLLSDLESRFADMLNRQQPINQDTLAIHQRSSEQLSRPDQLRTAELADLQSDLAAESGTCLHILEEDGTTIVFPSVVAQLEQDMKSVADRLARRQLGPITQSIEAEIVATLEAIIRSVQQMQEEEEEAQQQGESGPSDDEQPLLPGSAELKLLRAAQLRINRRTLVVTEVQGSDAEPTDDITQELRTLSKRQQKVADIAREMRDQDVRP